MMRTPHPMHVVAIGLMNGQLLRPLLTGLNSALQSPFKVRIPVRAFTSWTGDNSPCKADSIRFLDAEILLLDIRFLEC